MKRGDDPCWDGIVLKRRGAPPLRFQGRRLARHAVGLSDGRIQIDLWRRKTPGFVVGLTSPIRLQAVSVPTLDAAMAWLEEQCSADVDASDFGDISLQSMIDRAQVGLAERAALRALAGDALDHWDRFVDAEADLVENEEERK